MSIQFSIKYIIGIALVILILLMFRSINELKSTNNRLQTEKSLALQSFKTERNKVGELITLQDVIVTTDERIIDSLVKEVAWNKKIKKPTTIIKEVTKTEVVHVFVPFHDTLFSITNIVDSIPFSDSTKFYTIIGNVKPKGIYFNKISFLNDNTYVLAQKRYNLFYNKTVLYVNHKNPYTSTTGLQSVVLKKEPKKFIKIATVVVAFVAGTYLGIQLIK